jgi:hypothetical protein
MNQTATVDTFTQHLNLSESTVETLLNLNATELPKEEAFQTELGTLNLDLLRETLPTAKSVLENQLPAFYVWLKQELPIKRVPDSPNHTTTWAEGFYRWPLRFFLATCFWNLVGAGVFGFLINPPLVLYYSQGLNTTPIHAHSA